MPLYIASLNSGSNGNCYYIANADEAVLVDVGISCREVEKRMKRLGLDIRKVKAIFVSHEHGDHIHGVPALSKKHKIPTFITPKTHRESRLSLNDELVFSFQPYKAINIGKLSILAFPKFHDAIDPHSFVVSCEGASVGVFTDIGVSCEHVIKNFTRCHAVFLETNYDEEMLEKGAYPIHLKNRIRNGEGHLSNRQAVDLFQNYRAPFLSHIFLSHLSRNNNKPEIPLKLFQSFAEETEIILAPRDRETDIYTINTTVISDRIIRQSKKEQQLTLF